MTTRNTFLTILCAALVGCGGSSNDPAVATTTPATTTTTTAATTTKIDITNAVFEQRSGDCADYVENYGASVLDIQRSMGFEGDVVVALSADACVLDSNSIPNHDFNDFTARFATNVSAVDQRFEIPRNPQHAVTLTPLSQRTYDGVMLNGVPIDLLSAGCYEPTSPMADASGNTPIGCRENHPWLLEPLGPATNFGVDEHHAHVQPDGSYHYHGNPNAMFDDLPGPNGSPVIGFAADGYPIYGSYFYDAASGSLRKAVSGHTLKNGTRPSGADGPGGTYDGTYVADWEFTDAGDLDVCNGMEVDGQYGYYVTDSYPWIMNCHSGTPHASFQK